MSRQDHDRLLDLADPDPEVRRKAVWELGDTTCRDLSAEAIDGLSQATTDPDPDVRSTALFQLSGAELDESTTRTVLLRGFRDPHPEVRLMALGCIRRLEAIQASGWIVTELIERLEDEDPQVMGMALSWLGSLPRGAYIRAFGPPDRPLDDWIAEATAGDRRRRVVAMLALETSGVEALGPLERLSGDPDPIIRGAALIALGGIGPDALPIVQGHLDDADPGVHDYACLALGKIGAAAAPMLARLLRHPHGSIRWAAAESLIAIGSDAHAAAPELMEILRGPDVSAGEKAAPALAAVGAGHPGTVPALIEALRAPAGEIRYAAGYALTHFGLPAVEAIVPLLRRRFAHGHNGMGIDLGQLIATTAATRPDAVVTALGEALGDENPDVRVMAAAYLTDPALRGDAAVGLLERACHDPDPSVRHEVVVCLRELGAATDPDRREEWQV